MTEKEIENIIQDIEKSGLPCEIEATIRLSSSGWLTFNQSAYLDEDTEELRYIDLTAAKYLKSVPVEIQLTIECSKSDKPWVFYGIEREKNSIPEVCPHYYPKSNQLGLPTVCLSHQGKKDIFEGTIPYEPFTKGKSINILDAAMKTIKALRYKMAKDEEFDRQLKLDEINIFYPVIVFDGHLYSLVVDNGKINPVQRDYLMYQFEYKHGYYMIDIVTKSGLADFNELVNKEFRRIKEMYKKLPTGK